MSAQVPIRKQSEIARNEIGLKLVHISQPWLCWIALTILGNVLRLGFSHLRLLTALLVLACGAVIFMLDVHLRKHHGTLPGKLIGPVTTGAVTASLLAYLVLGLWLPLALTYFTVGFALCTCWDFWMLSAEHRDMGKAFLPAATKAGFGGSRLANLKRHANKITADIVMPSGEVITEDLSRGLEYLESGMQLPPGSLTVSPHPLDASRARAAFSDPAILAEAIPWPGPSAPGESVAVPFRLGWWQDADVMTYSILEHHMTWMGQTGAGKTCSALYGMAAEGMTRSDYAMFGFDVGKAEQFMGPLRPALHGIALDPDAALKLLTALHRVRFARMNYMGRQHLTRWKPGCGLTFLDLWLEEAPDIVALLGTTQKHRAEGRFMLADWVADVREARSAGMRWDISLQRSDFTQMPTLTRGQAGKCCFGVESADDARFGLTELQVTRECRPQLWGQQYPGKAYIDTMSIPDDRKSMPMRFYSWGDDSEKIAEYAALPAHAAARRPLDDVTGEALEAGPGPLASTAFPVPSFQQAAGAVDPDDPEDEHEGLPPVRQLRPVPQVRRPDQKEAWDMVTAQIAAWRAEGRVSFIRRDCDVLCGAAQRHSSWLDNTVLPKLVSDGILARNDSVRPFRWEILAPKAAQAADEVKDRD